MNETEGTNPAYAAGNAEWNVERQSYHVLMNSRRYGTSVFACKNVEDAASTMSWLALRAEQEQRQDGAQRFFCLLPPTLPAEETAALLLDGPDTPESEDALVVCLAEGALQWIAADGLEERPLIVLDAVGSEAEGPFICWQACPRPLRQLNRLHRHAVSRYLHLRRLRQTDEPDSRTSTNLTEEERSGLLDPVVCAWQQDHSDETPLPLIISALLETRGNEEPADTPKEVAG